MQRAPSFVRETLIGLLAIAVARSATAGVIVVDDNGGPGVDYTDLPPAIAAAASFDVILVSPGSYSSFVLSKDVTILGTGTGVFIAPGSQITGIGAGKRAVLCDLLPRDLRVQTCAGTVVLDGVIMETGWPTALTNLLVVDDCADVRAIRCQLGTSNEWAGSRGGARVTQSRMEIVQSLVNGGAGASVSCGAGHAGDAAVTASNTSRVHLAETNLRGGRGGGHLEICGSFCNLGAGDGGAGLEVLLGSELLATGLAGGHFLAGGFSGDGQACACDGDPGRGLLVHASVANWSGCVPLGGDSYCSGFAPAVGVAGGGSAQALPALYPMLERSGIIAPGNAITFTVFGEPGDVVELRVGRGPALISTPGVLIEELTTVLRIFQLGTIGAGGSVGLAIAPYATLPHGFDFYAQAIVVRAGQELRTNSTPVILR